MPAGRRTIPLRRRKLDQLLVFAFATFACTSFLFDRLSALYADLEAQSGFLVEYYVLYGKTIDPLVLANPLWLRAMCAVSAFVMGPFYLLLVWALIKGDERIRIPSIVYGCVITYSMVVHLAVEFLGDLPPLNLPAFLVTYVGYAVFPLLLVWRMRRRHPFSAPADEAA